MVSPPATAAASSPWVALGFGRVNGVAVRNLAPVEPALAADVVIRQATSDDLDDVERLVDEEAVFHAGSPMFRPYVRADTADAVRDELATALASDDHAHLIARRGGIEIGGISIQPGRGSPLYVPNGAVYISATAVLASERRSGTGAVLADAAFAWARDRGHLVVCLHYSTENTTSTSFWTGLGFTTAMVHMRRRLDERILTNRPPA